MKWAREVDVAPVDIEFLRRGFSAFIVAARQLETDNGRVVHPETGRPDERLVVHSGVHLRPGVVYESISTLPSPRVAAAALPHVTIEGQPVPIDDPAAQMYLRSLSGISTTSRSLITLEAMNEQQLRLAGVDEDTAWHLAVERPGKARTVTGGGRLDTGPSRWFGGDITFDGSVDVEGACSLGRESRNIAELAVEHRRFRLQVRVTASWADDRIVLGIRGTGKGRGVLRPVVTVASLVFGRRIEKIFDEALAGLDGDVESLTVALDSYETPDDLAHEMLLSMFDDPTKSTIPE